MAKQGKSKQDEYSGWLNEVRNNTPRPYPWKPYKDSLISPSHKPSKYEQKGSKAMGYIWIGTELIFIPLIVIAAIYQVNQKNIGVAILLLLLGITIGFVFTRAGLENLKHIPRNEKPPKNKK